MTKNSEFVPRVQTTIKDTSHAAKFTMKTIEAIEDE